MFEVIAKADSIDVRDAAAKFRCPLTAEVLDGIVKDLSLERMDSE